MCFFVFFCKQLLFGLKFASRVVTSRRVFDGHDTGRMCFTQGWQFRRLPRQPAVVQVGNQMGP